MSTSVCSRFQVSSVGNVKNNEDDDTDANANAAAAPQSVEIVVDKAETVQAAVYSFTSALTQFTRDLA
uniref:Ovule protein n=1 Tax=Syphacia muris TaxID=451379 RepID=A0A0N5A9V6_9BILA